jgi:hypothetical protein
MFSRGIEMIRSKRRRQSTQIISPDDILREASPLLRPIVRRLRKIVRHAAPALAEAGYPGWRCIAYRHPKAGYVCGIFPLEGTVRLYFEQGVRLADPIGILEGAGRQTRHLSFNDVATVAEKAAIISILVREAVALKDRSALR